MLLRILLFLIASGFAAEDNDFFALFNNLQNNINAEDIVMNSLKTFLDTQDLHLGKVKRYVESFKDLHKLAGEQLGEYLGDPINAYLLLRRLVVDWKEIEALLNQTNTESVLGALSQQMINASLPSEDDLNNAAMAIIQLQDVYKLNMADIMNGKIGAIDMGVSLTANDCLRLGQQAIVNMDLELALAWYEQGLIIVQRKSKNVNVPTYIEHIRRLKTALKTSLKLITPDIMETISSIPGIPSELLHHITERTNGGTSPQNAIQEMYKKLCQNQESENSQSKNNLDCIFLPHDTTYDLQRMKVEYLSYQPLMVMIHDIISDNEMEFIKAVATPMLEPTKVHKYSDAEQNTHKSSVRTGKAMWLPRNTHQMVTNIYKRVEDAIGLSTKNAEHLHVVNYNIGGHYEVHADFFDYKAKGLPSEYGDRIATMLFYLSDVPAGGSTVFPHLSLSVKPKKGSALFWFNLMRNGNGDFRTIHAACPVLSGTKWVANMWIMDRDQVFTRPCSLKEDE